MRRRVVITGMGAVTPLGLTASEAWGGLIHQECGITKIDGFDVEEAPIKYAGLVRNFDARTVVDGKHLKLMNKPSTFSVAAAIEAVADSQLDLPSISPEMLGVYLGTGESGYDAIYDFFMPAIEISLDNRKLNYEVFGQEGLPMIDPFFLIKGLHNNAMNYLSIKFGAKGENNTFVMSGVAGTQALGEACRLVATRKADVMLVGACDSIVTFDSMISYLNTGAVSADGKNSSRAIKPFSLGRDGYLLGEGSAFLVIESLESAIKRGAKCYAEIIGYACTADAYRPDTISSDTNMLSECLRQAVKDSGADSVDYICANGNATKEGDAAETKAIKNVFGDRAYRLPISGIKAATGYMGSASGLFEVLVCALAIDTGTLPPTLNYAAKDPVCDLDYVPNEARYLQKIKTAVSIDMAQGGQNTAVALARP